MQKLRGRNHELRLILKEELLKDDVDSKRVASLRDSISKNEGRMINLSNVNTSLLANGIASSYEKDPRLVELILSESKRIVRMEHGIIIVETNYGFVCANAGIDDSNVKDGYVTLLPIDPDKSLGLITTENVRLRSAVDCHFTPFLPFPDSCLSVIITVPCLTPSLINSQASSFVESSWV